MLFQGLGGADIGLDHHLFDELHGVERDARLDLFNIAVGIETDAAFRRIDVQRLAGIAATRQAGMRRPQRLQQGLQDRSGLVVRCPVDGGLGLFIAQLGGGAHQAAMKGVTDLAALGVEHHAHSQGGAVLALLQRTQARGQDVRQHRLHAVGEVGRIALVASVAVEAGARGDIVGDVGDGDPYDPAPRICGVFVSVGIDRVVMVLGIDRIDGDEGQVAQIGAFA